VLSGIGLAGCIAGLIAIWVARPSVLRSSLEILDATEDGLKFVEEKATRADELTKRIRGPVPRTAQRWLQTAGLNPAPRGRRPGVNAHRATAPHEIWQMDGAECIRLANGEPVGWLRIVDELTGAAWQTTIFPPGTVVSGRYAARSGGLTPRFHALGSPQAFPRGQRSAVGVGGRSSHGAGVLADWVGYRDDLEPATTAAGQRRD
jgi:hypothetical protein